MQNSKIQLHDLCFERYIECADIEVSIDNIARKINLDFSTCHRSDRPPLVVVTLSGAMIFASELVKKLDFIVEIAFVKCTSYNDNICSSDTVRFDVPLTISPQGRDVIVIEDIVDTGNTYVALHEHLTNQQAASICIATLLLKPDAYRYNLKIDYSCIEVANSFVVGYGLDYNQLGRNLPDIYKLVK